MRFPVAGLGLSLSLVVAGCASTPTPPASSVAVPRISAPVAISDELEGAPYRIDIPANWNGDVVMLLHGYEPKGVPRQTAWPQNEAAPVFLARGYAVAASAYRTQGWAVAEALPDIERLRQHFAATYGQPRHTYLAGFSLGGHLALASLEQQGRHYAGALSLCGINMPAAVAFDEVVVTALVALDSHFPQALSLAAGGLTDPSSPAMPDPEAIEAALAGNEAVAAQLSERLQVPRPALSGAMMLYYIALREMQQRAGGMPVDNRKTVYAGFGDDAAFNRGVRRYAADPQAAAYLKAHVSLSGRVDAPVVLMSNTADQTIPVRFQRNYPELVRAAGRGDKLVVLPAVGEGHCDFTAEQIDHAFATLVNRVDQPAGTSHNNAAPSTKR